MKNLKSTIFLLAFGFYGSILHADKLIHDISQTHTIPIKEIVKPKTVQELQSYIKSIQGPISIAGARCSQGGQIAYPQGTVIDMTDLNKVVSFDQKNKLITVQAGTTWRDVQEYIDPYNLAVRVMQSYNDFTVGGSVSVNVHARMVQEGSLITSVESMDVVTADGKVVIASRSQNPELFKAVLGGYGLLGVVARVTLRLTDNELMERRIVRTSVENVHSFFTQKIVPDKKALFFNAVVYPSRFDVVDLVTFYKTNKQPTIKDRLGKAHRWNVRMQVGEFLLRRLPFLAPTRKMLQGKDFKKENVVWRNYEMSAYTINDLEMPSRFFATSILQEYFVPVDKLEKFMEQFKKIAHEDKINVLNASIRFVPADTESLLSYAPVDSYAIVLYINIWNNNFSLKTTRIWTQKLVDAALSAGGRYYLPYHTFATKQQFDTAYPEFKTLLALKAKYDPTNKFRNMLLKTYA